MDVNNVVCSPARRSDGKKIDTWKIKLPGTDNNYVKVDVYMTRDDDSVYSFHLEVPIGEKRHRIESTNPSELKDLVNELVMADIEKTWEKGLLIMSSAYGNERTSPEEPGSHELSVEWHVVYHRQIKNFLCYSQDGELFTRTHYVGKDAAFTRSDTPRIIPWTQHRENVLRNLGKVLHEASDKLEMLVKEGGITKAIDETSMRGHLLTEGSI